MSKINVKELLQSRPLSWSAISRFEYNPEEWYQKYILGIVDTDNKEMIFGKLFAKSIEDGKPLAPISIVGKAEHVFKVVFNGIPLIGFVDNFCTETNRKLREYKTGKKPWDQKRVDAHGQIDMYLLMNYITNKVRPEEVECALEWIPTIETGDFKIEFAYPITVHHFKTKRTLSDIINFGARINSIVNAMQTYVNSKNN